MLGVSAGCLGNRPTGPGGRNGSEDSALAVRHVYSGGMRKVEGSGCRPEPSMPPSGRDDRRAVALLLVSPCSAPVANILTALAAGGADVSGARAARLHGEVRLVGVQPALRGLRAL